MACYIPGRFQLVLGKPVQQSAYEHSTNAAPNGHVHEALHLSWFCKNLSRLTILSDDVCAAVGDSILRFVRKLRDQRTHRLRIVE